jgi:hypothetical protein
MSFALAPLEIERSQFRSCVPEPSLHQNAFLGQPVFQALGEMIRIAAAIFAAALSVSTAAAQSTAASGDKPETACTTSPAATTGSGEEKTANSMAVEKSAVLPDAGGANSAAPTVQSGGKPLKVNPDCPPDSKPK